MRVKIGTDGTYASLGDGDCTPCPSKNVTWYLTAIFSVVIILALVGIYYGVAKQYQARQAAMSMYMCHVLLLCSCALRCVISPFLVLMLRCLDQSI
jgi:hypothetical protein